MDIGNKIIQETPEMDFSEDIVQETPIIEFSEEQVDRFFEEIEQETPDIDFDDKAPQDLNKEGITADESDIDDLDEPDQFVEDNDDANTNQNVNNTDKKTEKCKTKVPQDNRLLQLPTARVKHIMKVDPDVSLITAECTFLVAKATELFIESLVRESFLHTAQSKKKTVQKRDVDAAIENVESLMFFEGMMNF